MAGNVKSTKFWFLFGGDRHHFPVIFGPNESFRRQNVKVIYKTCQEKLRVADGSKVS